jgi:hypothetical protein
LPGCGCYETAELGVVLEWFGTLAFLHGICQCISHNWRRRKAGALIGPSMPLLARKERPGLLFEKDEAKNSYFLK